jgi:hypothetical protein
MVSVLQFTENMTDRQAAEAVRGRLDWKNCSRTGRGRPFLQVG